MVRSQIDDDYETKHVNILDEYLPECMVLLRKNGDFPLNGEKSIALYGNGVRKTIKGGTGSGEVNSRYFETIEEAFTKEGYEILTKKYLDNYDKEYEKALKKFKNHILVEILKNPITGIMNSIGAIMNEPEYKINIDSTGDVAIYVLSRVSGEGSDRTFVKGDFLLTDTEKNIILSLARGYKKFMLVLNTGGPVDLSGLEEVENILVLSQLGVNTSKALVDVISGKKYPSGKLTTTWTKSSDYPTIGNFGDSSDTNYKEGIYVGYRYFDTANMEVMFPFGYGLGYTDFNYNVQSVNLVNDEVTVQASVQNIGNFKGKEILELYLSKPNTELDEPYQVLVGFEKSKELAPSETDSITLNFKLSDFTSYYARNATYILDKGDYIVRLGNSSRNTEPCAIINIESRIVVKQVHNKLDEPGFEDVKIDSNLVHPGEGEEDLTNSNLPRFTLDPNCIEKETITYDKVFEIPEEVKQLSKEDKAHLVIGAFNPSGGLASVIGSASTTVAGAAGETATVAGLSPVIMADGPAGLRLASDYYTDRDGNHSTQGSIPISMQQMLPGVIQWVFSLFNPKPPKNAEIKHQYTTAIPIGTAIAQTWNKEFAEICGDIVGTEMGIFNVHLWLAPALNIHRNVLCGRNYEYYSEDPFISGIFAAAVTNGVQKHKNAYVTIKHFAANNQEYNRYGSSSNVSERALREIYLKGFEYCLKRSQPKAVMTSYNLINGVHTSESKELTLDILRNEFDFDGIVMTDWIVASMFTGQVAKYANPSATGVVKATGDIYMPGSKDDYNNILDNLKNKKLSMEELELSASRIYKLAKEVHNNN
ncbi:beta-glucosidase-related glycosidase [Anaeromyces robustus]|jgi:beta-glucosidase|uniref:beta-glucosidase n=1 Tax=Anaeromyces robustus TaxID=1754192 RepID=A0A1Y1X0L2_9FUNG|nr:beta-glucosidase-related glycosidase [Anaeromyces robustus]|eukprot:ORX79330.1 beta-glucosidase-related glycosidase [Anaeromyces robustus]